MKKIILVFVTMLTICSMVSCAEDSSKRENEISQILENFTIQYGLDEIPVPEIKVTSSKKIESMSGIPGSNATYRCDEKVIYVAKELNGDYAKEVLAHEVFHYINHYESEFQETYGFDFCIKNQPVGYFLTEGITQYFSEQLYPLSERWALYPRERLIGEQLDIILDAKDYSLFDLFIHSNVDEMKRIFNEVAYESGLEDVISVEGFKLTPFELLCLYIDISSEAKLVGDQSEFLVYTSLAENEIYQMCVFLERENEYHQVVDKYVSKYGKNILGIG